jgi:hypothetical protein
MVSPVLAAKVTKKFKTRVRRSLKKSGLSESEFVRSAVVTFLESHPTPEAQIAAVVKIRTNATRE